MFQTYPIESFMLPEKFEAMLGVRQTGQTCTKQDTTANFVSRVSFENQRVSKSVLGIQMIRYDYIGSGLCFLYLQDHYTSRTNKV